MIDQKRENMIEEVEETFLSLLEDWKRPEPALSLNRWPLFNKYVGGFREREFSVLCGPSGYGKTAFLANMSSQLMEQHVKHFVMSIETGQKDFLRRMLSVYEEEDLNTGDPLSTKRIADISTKYLQLLSKRIVKFSLYESRVALAHLLEDISRMVAQGCKIVFIDNLNYILKVTRSQDAIMEMDNVIHELIQFVKRNPIHIVMVMHPRKTEGERVESVWDIKGSSTAIQEAQNVFLFNPPTTKSVKDGDRNWYDREFKILKMRRRGHHVGKTIVFNYSRCRYSEIAMYER